VISLTLHTRKEGGKVRSRINTVYREIGRVRKRRRGKKNREG
jgi:hypothetical protein